MVLVHLGYRAVYWMLQSLLISYASLRAIHQVREPEKRHERATVLASTLRAILLSPNATFSTRYRGCIATGAQRLLYHVLWWPAGFRRARQGRYYLEVDEVPIKY